LIKQKNLINEDLTPRILLKNFTAITVADQGILKDVSIVIDAGKISKIGHNLGELKLNAYDKVIDGQGKVVIPGLINAHTHAAMVLLRGFADGLPLRRWLEEKIWPAERRLTTEDVYWASLLAIIEMIKSGTTTFADMYFFEDEVAQAVQQSGIRALLGQAVVARGIDHQAEKQLAEATELMENWKGKAGGRIRTAFAPHSCYVCGKDLLNRITQLAKDYNTRVHIHLSETREEVEESLATKQASPVQFLDRLGLFEVPTLAAHCVHLSAEDINILADRKSTVSVVHCPKSEMKLGSGIAPIPKCLKAGVNVALGTDGAASDDTLNMLEEARCANYLQGARGEKIAAVDLLHMATVNGAKALGLEKQVGTIEEGKKADLVILDLDTAYPLRSPDLIDALVQLAQPKDIQTVIIDGRVVMEDGNVLTIDEEEVKAKVKQLSKKYRED